MKRSMAYHQEPFETLMVEIRAVTSVLVPFGKKIKTVRQREAECYVQPLFIFNILTPFSKYLTIVVPLSSADLTVVYPLVR